MLLLWEESRFSAPIVLAKNCMFSLGSAVTPFITNLFLVPLQRSNDSSILLEFDNYSSPIDTLKSAACRQTLFDKDVMANTTINNDVENISLVRLAFITGGVGYGLAATIYFLAWTCNKLTFTRRRIKSSEREPVINYSSFYRPLQLEKLSMYMVLFFFNGWLLLNVIQLLSTLLQCGLDWNVDQATRMMTVFYAMLLVGRVSSIPLSFFVMSEIILAVNLVAQAIGISMLFLAYNGFIRTMFLWFGSGCIGFGTSTVLGNVFVWIAKSERISGRLSALLMLSYYSGAIVGPAVSGFSIDYVGYDLLIYTMLLGVTMQCISFTGALVLTKALVKRQTNSQEKYITVVERRPSIISIS